MRGTEVGEDVESLAGRRISQLQNLHLIPRFDPVQTCRTSCRNRTAKRWRVDVDAAALFQVQSFSFLFDNKSVKWASQSQSRPGWRWAQDKVIPSYVCLLSRELGNRTWVGSEIYIELCFKPISSFLFTLPSPFSPPLPLSSSHSTLDWLLWTRTDSLQRTSADITDDPQSLLAQKLDHSGGFLFP